jgi:hypothetical protein
MAAAVAAEEGQGDRGGHLLRADTGRCTSPEPKTPTTGNSCYEKLLLSSRKEGVEGVVDEVVEVGRSENLKDEGGEDLKKLSLTKATEDGVLEKNDINLCLDKNEERTKVVETDDTAGVVDETSLVNKITTQDSGNGKGDAEEAIPDEIEDDVQVVERKDDVQVVDRSDVSNENDKGTQKAEIPTDYQHREGEERGADETGKERERESGTEGKTG